MPTAYAIMCLGKNEMSIQTDTQAKPPDGGSIRGFCYMYTKLRD